MGRKLSLGFLFAGLLVLASVPATHAQVTITYVDADLNPNNYDTSGASDPTTLELLSGSAEQSGILSGSGAIIKTGAGTLALSNANTYSGGTVINGGLVNFITLGNLGSGNITLDGGGLQWAADNTTDISARLNPFGAGGATFDTNGNSLTLASALTDAGSNAPLMKLGSGTLTLSGANTYSGGTTINAGTLQFATVASLAGGPMYANLYVSSGATVAFNVGGAGEFSSSDLDNVFNNNLAGFQGGAIIGLDTTNAGGNFTYGSVIADTTNGSIGLAKLGSGTLTLTGANTYSGGTTIYAGKLNLGSSSLNSDGNVTSDPGQVSFSPVGTGDIKLYDGSTLGVANDAGPITLANNLVLDCRNGTNIWIDTTNGNLNLAGVISGEAGLTLTGGNSLALLGDNTFTGGMTVTAGSILQLGSSTKNSDGTVITDPAQISTGPIGNGQLTLNDGATLSTAGVDNVTFANPIYLSGTDGVTFDLSNRHTPDGTNYYYDALTLGGPLTGTAPINLYGLGNLQDGYHAGGQLFLEGDNSGWSGGLNVYGNNSVYVYNQNGLGTGPLWLNPAGSATVEFTNGSPTIGGLSGGHSGVDYNSTVLVDSGTTLAINQNTPGTFAGVIAGAGNIEKDGAALLTLSAANTYTGDTVVHAGELDVSGGSIGTSTSDVTVGLGSGDNATLGILNAATVSSDTGSIGDLSGSIGAATVNGAGSSWTNANYLYVGAAGTGTLTISNGGAVISPETSIGNNAGGIGTLTVTGTGSSLTTTDAVYIGAAGNGTLSVQNGAAVSDTIASIGNNSGGAGGATVTGAGSTWTTSSNLIVGDATTGFLTVTNGGHVSSASANIGAFSGVTGQASVSGSGSTWSTTVMEIGYYGNGSLELDSGGTLAVNSGAGTVTLGYQAGSAGTVNIGSAVTGPAAAGGMVDAAAITTGGGSGTVQFNTTATSASPYYLTTNGTSGGAAVIISGPTQVINTGGFNVITGANTYTGGTTINGGTLVAGNNSAFGTGAITLGGGQLGVGSGITLGNSLSFTGGTPTTLSGNGTINSHITADNHVIVSPGNSPGNLTFSAGLTLAALGEYDWQLQSVAGAPLSGAGTNWDLVSVSAGTLDLPTTGNFTLKVISLNSGGTAGSVSDFSPGSTYTWTIATAPGGITGNVGNISIDTSLFSNLPNAGGFSLSVSGGTDLNLTFSPVPEPSEYALMVLGLGFLVVAMRRKVSRHSR